MYQRRIDWTLPRLDIAKVIIYQMFVSPVKSIERTLILMVFTIYLFLGNVYSFHLKISELGSGKSVEPVDSLGHLQIRELPELSNYPSHFSNKKQFSNARPGNSPHFM